MALWSKVPKWNQKYSNVTNISEQYLVSVILTIFTFFQNYLYAVIIYDTLPDEIKWDLGIFDTNVWIKTVH